MTFQYVKPNEDQKVLMQKFRYIMESLSNEISNSIKDSRGKSLCLTKLEEASFWLNKSITEND